MLPLPLRKPSPNGTDWLELLRADPGEYPQLPDHPTWQEIAHAYAQHSLHYRGQWPHVVAAIQWLHGNGIAMRAALERLETHAGTSPPPLPPMRGRADTIHDMAETASQDAVREVRAYERNPSTPPGPAGDIALEKIISARVAAALDSRDAAKWRDLEHEQANAEEERRQIVRDSSAQRRKMKWRLIGIGLTTLAAVLWALVEHFAKK